MNKSILLLIFLALNTPFYTNASEAPLLEAKTAKEQRHLENRRLWVPHDQPGSFFTDPAHHDETHYAYIVHRPYHDHPDFLDHLEYLHGERLLSTSLITHTHNQTFGAPTKGTLILRVPEELIIATSPVDIGFDTSAINPETDWIDALTSCGICKDMTPTEMRATFSVSPMATNFSQFSDDDCLKLQSILLHGNRLRIELGKTFRKFGIHAPQEVIQQAAVRKLGTQCHSGGHTEIALKAKQGSHQVEVIGVQFFRDTESSEKEAYRKFATERGLPCVELEAVKMNPPILTMPDFPPGRDDCPVQDLPLHWEDDEDL